MSQKDNINELDISDEEKEKILNEVNKIDISIDNISSESKYTFILSPVLRYKIKDDYYVVFWF